MDHKDALDRDEMIEFVMSCWDDEAGRWWLKYWLGSNRFTATGAFGAHPDHDAHLLSTLSAIQILVTHDALDRLDIPRVVKCMWEIDNLQPIAFLTTPPLCAVILSLQQPSGVFAGDSFGETDTRFLYCAVNALSLLGHLSDLDVEKTVSYIRKCRNFDGGFGAREGAESHAGQGKKGSFHWSSADSHW